MDSTNESGYRRFGASHDDRRKVKHLKTIDFGRGSTFCISGPTGGQPPEELA
jgi:hypothetical protein